MIKCTQDGKENNDGGKKSKSIRQAHTNEDNHQARESLMTDMVCRVVTAMQQMHKKELLMQQSSPKELVGCIRLVFSRRPRALLRRLIIGICKPSSIVKGSPQVKSCSTKKTLYKLKYKCYFEAQVWILRIAMLPPLSFFSFSFLFIYFLFLSGLHGSFIFSHFSSFGMF